MIVRIVILGDGENSIVIVGDIESMDSNSWGDGDC